MDTSENHRDGRVRTQAAWENGEKWLPVAIYSFEDDSAKKIAADGIICNLHKPAKRAVPADFKRACVDAINAGELLSKKEDIEEYLSGH